VLFKASGFSAPGRLVSVALRRFILWYLPWIDVEQPQSKGRFSLEFQV